MREEAQSKGSVQEIAPRPLELDAASVDVLMGDEVPAPLLNVLFTGRHKALRPWASLFFGIGGCIVFAIWSVASTRSLVAFADRTHPGGIIELVLGGIVTIAIACAGVTVILTIQLIVSNDLPITIQLGLVYAIVLSSVHSIFERQNGSEILILSTISLSGYLMRVFWRWQVLWFQQSVKGQRRLSIARILDWTSAIALTLAIAVRTFSNVPVRSLGCLIPAIFLFVLFGLHSWTRLLSLCQQRAYRDVGFGWWMSGNILAAFILFLIITLSTKPPPSLIGLLIAPVFVLSLHFWTAIPIGWLKLCGWQLKQAENRSVDTRRNSSSF